ncbi:uncharacterized protein V1516DRAFT_674184 [Lipomyces oligophaga]|uniref:uncharacterized protein n=1 Tax=Lipomyces oligophaga TaxID=45792 RepID=UPI0034CF341B
MGLSLVLKAELTGVTNLEPIDEAGNPYIYSFEIQCTSCREKHDKYVEVTAWETHEISGSRGEANFVWKCKMCRREGSASFVRQKPNSYDEEDSGKWKPIVEFEVRGLEFTAFKVEGPWRCKSAVNNTVFDELDLQEDEWFDYDEKASTEVSITEIAWDLKRS